MERSSLPYGFWEPNLCHWIGGMFLYTLSNPIGLLSLFTRTPFLQDEGPALLASLNSPRRSHLRILSGSTGLNTEYEDGRGGGNGEKGWNPSHTWELCPAEKMNYAHSQLS